MTISSDVRAMVVAGFSREDIVARFGASSAVAHAYQRAVEKPVARPYGTVGVTKARAQREAIRGERALGQWQFEQAKAGILHLVDLKRAGHSPRSTEYRIPTDIEKPATFYRPLAHRSYCGSSAAFAAEMSAP